MQRGSRLRSRDREGESTVEVIRVRAERTSGNYWCYVIRKTVQQHENEHIKSKLLFDGENSRYVSEPQQIRPHTSITLASHNPLAPPKTTTSELHPSAASTDLKKRSRCSKRGSRFQKAKSLLTQEVRYETQRKAGVI